MIFPLEIFPVGGLAGSVTTAVWIGVIVVVFYNVRFGTTLSGLVVPGYLVPLFLIKPMSGWVIIGEAILTYFIAKLIAERGLIKLRLSEMFGRDRFFILILCSILVRVISDAFILPFLSDWLLEQGVVQELRSNLHSFGLIIIALCANQFWNGGFKTGAITIALYLLTTYFLIAEVLIPYTNFNITTLSFMYEDIASSVLASPKAYIILVTAAFIASRMNLKYGWDYNGILIPSLLALQWYNPSKILVTFVEAFVILIISQLILKLPLFQRMNIEGGRQILFFFNVGFIYKIMLGFTVANAFPYYNISDLYGFGYLLSTLIALKMYQKGLAIKMTRTILQTSISATLLASVLGFSLTLINFNPPVATTLVSSAATAQKLDQPLKYYLNQLIASSFDNSKLSSQSLRSNLGFATEYKLLFTQLLQLKRYRKVDLSNETIVLAEKLGLQLSIVQGKYLLISDKMLERGFGFYVINLLSNSELLISVPRTVEEPMIAEVAPAIYTHLDAGYLAFSSTRAKRSDDGSDDVLLNSQSVFHYYHEILGNQNTLQLRKLRPEISAYANNSKDHSILWITRSLPANFSLQKVSSYLGKLEINWKNTPFQNRQRDVMLKGFSELYLDRNGIINLLAKQGNEISDRVLEREQRLSGYLQEFLNQAKLYIADKKSQEYIPPTQSQLLYFDNLILQPLLELSEKYPEQDWNKQALSLIPSLLTSASQFGYEIFIYRHKSSSNEYLILRESFDDKQILSRRNWGTYVIKLGKAENYIVEIPAPKLELGTFEFGVKLFEQLEARALLISGSHLRANRDGSSLVTSIEQKYSLFNLFHQSLVRFYRLKNPHVVQIRGASKMQSDSNEIELNYYPQQRPRANREASFTKLEDYIQSLFNAEPSEAKRVVVSQASRNAQSRFLEFIPQARFSEIKLPIQLRRSFQSVDDNDLIPRKLEAIGIPVSESTLQQQLSGALFSQSEATRISLIRSSFEDFERSGNVGFLLNITDHQPDIKLSALLDKSTLQLFLIIKHKGAIEAIVRFSSVSNTVMYFTSETDINLYLNSQVRWLMAGEVR
jgi:gamma-polyglutamate biosynthesis protein CapC